VEYYNLDRMDRQAVLICITVCFAAIVTGVSLQLHLLSHEHSREHDYERADADRDGKVDFCDFALMASNWENSHSIVGGNLNSENYE